MVCTSPSVPGGLASLRAGSVRHTLYRALGETPLPAWARVRHLEVWGSRLAAPALPLSLSRAFFFLRASGLRLSKLLVLALPVPFCCSVSLLGETFRVYSISINKPRRAAGQGWGSDMPPLFLPSPCPHEGSPSSRSTLLENQTSIHHNLYRRPPGFRFCCLPRLQPPPATPAAPATALSLSLNVTRCCYLGAFTLAASAWGTLSRDLCACSAPSGPCSEGSSSERPS